MISVKSTVASCLDLRPPFSIKRDVLGVLARHRVEVISDNMVVGTVPYSQVRSLKHQLNLIRTRPFVRVAIVTVRPVGSNEGAADRLQEDLDTANAIYQQECHAWIHFTSHTMINTDRFGTTVTVDSDSDELTDDEAALLELGKDLDAAVVGYFVGRLTSAEGSASSEYRAFWLTRRPFPPQIRKYIFTHELSHVVGGLDHLCEDRSNVMCDEPDWGQGATLNEDQCRDILSDRDMRTCRRGG